jgi:hypothetical protein
MSTIFEIDTQIWASISDGPGFWKNRLLMHSARPVVTAGVLFEPLCVVLGAL